MASLATFGAGFVTWSLGAHVPGGCADRHDRKAAMLITVVMVLLGGLLSNRFGRRPVMLYPQILFCLLVVPCFYWLVTGRDALSFVAANVILATVIGFGAASERLDAGRPRAATLRA